jgi:3-oxoacyl-[acyl-carrier protein] reductase
MQSGIVRCPAHQISETPTEGAMKSLRGRVAIVTGGASGVGRGIAVVLAGEGANVVVADVDAGAATAAAAELPEAGGSAMAVEVDVSSRPSVERMAAVTLDARGRIDILCSNAGIYPSGALAELTEDEWDRVMAINVRGALYAMQASVPAMRKAGYGRIVVTSSITGPIVAHPFGAHYAASKAALLGLVRTVALEVVREGVTVNAVQPGNVRTPGFERLPEHDRMKMVESIPLGRLAEPEEVGWAVRYLVSEEAAYVTGQTLVLDGGQVLPEGKA